MRKALTAKTIDALKPQDRRYEVHDALCPGLSVRVSTRGQKVFTQKYRYGLRQKRLKLGVYPRISLVEARQRGLEALRLVDQGIDPAVSRRQLSMLVEAVCKDFIRQYAKPRNRSWQEAERIIQREFVAAYGQQDIRRIVRADILALMDQAIERGASYQANRIHSHLRKLFNWCLERGTVEASPVVGIRPPTREQARDRVLDDSEIIRVMKACAAEPYAKRDKRPLCYARIMGSRRHCRFCASASARPTRRHGSVLRSGLARRIQGWTSTRSSSHLLGRPSRDPDDIAEGFRLCDCWGRAHKDWHRGPLRRGEYNLDLHH